MLCIVVLVVFIIIVITIIIIIIIIIITIITIIIILMIIIIIIINIIIIIIIIIISDRRYDFIVLFHVLLSSRPNYRRRRVCWLFDTRISPHFSFPLFFHVYTFSENYVAPVFLPILLTLCSMYFSSPYVRTLNVSRFLLSAS